MTTQEILEESFSLGGNITDLDVYQSDGVTFDITTSGSVKLLQMLNVAQNQIANWKDPSDGRQLRLSKNISTMYFKTYVIDDTVSSVSDTTFPYSIVLANSSGLLGSTDDEYNEWVLEVTSGSASGQIRLVTDYTGSSKTFYIHDDYDTDPSAADTVKLYKRFCLLLPSTHSFVTEHISLPAETDVSRADGNFIEVLKITDVLNQKELDRALRVEGFPAYIQDYGDPTQWYRKGNKIYFDLNQRDTNWFEMEYYRGPTALAAVGDIPELPLQYHYALVLWMVWWIQKRQQESTNAYSAFLDLTTFMRSTRSPADVAFSRSESYGQLRKD